jgi:hypothetical protein
MFVAAPGLIRGMWRIKAGKTAPEIAALPASPTSTSTPL